VSPALTDACSAAIRSELEEQIDLKHFPSPEGGKSRYRQSPSGLLCVLRLYVVFRLLSWVWAAFVVALAPVQVVWEKDIVYQTIQRAYPHTGRVVDLLFGAWYRWDTGWYMTIAVHGYSLADSTVIFPPFYPLLVRLLGWLLGGEYFIAGLAISNLAFVGALYLLYLLVSEEFSQSSARKSLVWLTIFPGAFFYLTAYSESLFLLLAVLTFFAAHRRIWWLAGIASFLATLTRLTGWVLVVPVAWEALTAAGWRHWPIRPRAWIGQAFQARRGLLAAAAGPAGLILYEAYLRLADLPSVREIFADLWQLRIAWPWVSVARTVGTLLSGQISLVQIANLLCLLLFVVLMVAGVKRLRPSWCLYVLFSMLFFLMRDFPTRQLDGTLRYTAVLFPCFVALALRLRNRWLNAGLAVVFLLLHALFLGLFVRWLWVA
jgi:hypothetical protein